MENLITPYGGTLKNLLVSSDRAAELKQAAFDYPSVDLDWRQLCELEMLLTGALSPLEGYMGQADVESVLAGMHLPDGTFWPMPLTLSVSEKTASALRVGQTVALRDAEGFMPAVLHVSEIWAADPDQQLAWVARSDVPMQGTPGKSRQVCLAGRVEGVALPPRHDFMQLRLTPAEMRAQFARRGWQRVLAYAPSQPMHRAQYEHVLRVAVQKEANLLIHAAAGADPVHDPHHATLIRACQALLPRFPAATTMLALSPLTTTACGPRESLLKAIIARNYGCTHLIVGGESAADGDQRRGVDLPNLEHPVFRLANDSLGVALLPFPRMLYVEDRDEFLPETEVPAGVRTQTLSGTELSRRLMQGLRVPDWYSYPEVIAEMVKSYPPRSRQGFTVFFTGLSGAGKSTLARALTVKLMELGGRRVTLLDGDVVRRHLSSELGFSKEHRDINIRRIGFVASEITKNGGVAICAPIAPYRRTRRDVRAMIEPWGGFIEVFVSTPIQVCESRDRKGLYAKARAGLIPEFTGVSDPYEVPETAELMLDTSQYSVDEAIQRVVLKLEHEGYLR